MSLPDRLPNYVFTHPNRGTLDGDYGLVSDVRTALTASDLDKALDTAKKISDRYVRNHAFYDILSFCPANNLKRVEALLGEIQVTPSLSDFFRLFEIKPAKKELLQGVNILKARYMTDGKNEKVAEMDTKISRMQWWEFGKLSAIMAVLVSVVSAGGYVLATKGWSYITKT